MANSIKIRDIFNGNAMPDITYVAQEEGKYEQLLRNGLEEGGTLCLLTGSSKTGKTTLYKKVLSLMSKEPLIIRSDSTLSAEDLWRESLEKVDFSRLTASHTANSTEVSSDAKITGKIGWSWLAELIGEVTLGIKKNHSETDIREKIVSKASPHHLIPLLKYSNAVLVIEDFHYLKDNVQKEVFQQWKAFTDDQVSVLVVGTTHHGVDLAYANSDLVGRIQQVDLGRWSTIDLIEIAKKGFKKLDITPGEEVLEIISNESSGLPIITQQVCAQLFIDKKSPEVKIGEKLNFSREDAFGALHEIASTKYGQFSSWYSRLTIGPRKRARKYNTYEIILLVFALNPLEFELSRHAVDERIKRLNLAGNQIPPAPSINSTLSALEKFQERNGFKLLEWSKRDQTIYVLEPAFLFFIRWREKRKEAPNSLDLIKNFIVAIRQVQSKINHSGITYLQSESSGVPKEYRK